MEIRWGIGKYSKRSLLITSVGSIKSPFINREHWILDKPSLNTILELSCDNSFNSGSFFSFSNISWGGDFTFGLQKIVRMFNSMIELDQKRKTFNEWVTVNLRCLKDLQSHNNDLIRCLIPFPCPLLWFPF